ncbi:YihY/virulence factor BrkB family protein [Ancrocorticia populi]|uniref:YihY/virulence factor BrkB family protein n=1 Tax=Ancrocorticia populi TaxID=2175228 RepID=A0A2V1KBB2_9ACTO|nr:YihY/virulence factor BrkB family protein [Ancrocorticia populi]PWF27590.1 YihY/virulence factor BrkB family protein [Ancrocorticia populi]
METESAVAKAKTFAERVQDLRIVRSLSRYGAARGGLLSGGIAYSALFSIAAGLTIAWTVFMSVLGNNQELKDQVLDSIDSALPGIIDTGDGSGGIIDPDALVLDSAVNLASIIAAVVLLWTAMSTMGAFANSIRAMFGIRKVKENPVLLNLRNLGGFVVLAVGIASSSVISTGAGSLNSTVLDWIGIEGAASRFLIRVGTLLISVAVDALILAFLVRIMSGVRVPRRDLWVGSAIGGVAMSVIRLLGTSAVGSVADNALLASVAAIATLLLWLNLCARVVLMASAFMANPPRPEKIESPEELHFKETPNYITLTEPQTLNWNFNPVTGDMMVQPVEHTEPNDHGVSVSKIDYSDRTSEGE